MNRRRRLPVLFCAWLAAGCGGGEVPAPAPAGPGPSGATPVRVATAGPERGTIRRVTEEPGRVEPFETTPIHAKLAGYVRSVRVFLGDAVKEGETLAELEVPEVEAEAEQRRAAVAQAEAGARQAAAAVEVARSALAVAEARRDEAAATTRRTVADLGRWQAEYSRIEQLLRESAITASLRDETRGKLESARAAAEEAEAKVKSSDAAVREARAGLDKATADAAAAVAAVEVAGADARRAEALLGYRRIVAPFDGIVTQRNVHSGHLTVPGGSAPTLFVLARVDRLTVVVDVPEGESPLVNPGDPARIRFPALGGRIVEAPVSRTSGSLDPVARTLRVEVDIPGGEEAGAIRPGLYAHASIVAEERSDVLTIPAAAVVRDSGNVACVVVESGRARRKPVVLGLGDGTRVEVVSGLDPGDRIVVSNADALRDGQAVESSPSEKAPGAASR